MRNQRISVIVPVYNEVTTIEQIQRELLPIKNRCEIILLTGEVQMGRLRGSDRNFVYCMRQKEGQSR